MFASVVSIHILGGDGGNASSYPGFKIDVSLMPWDSKGAHEPCLEWLVSMMNGRVEAQVPGYERTRANKNEYPGINGSMKCYIF
ncbi:MAG: hypothetical protein QXW30_02265 [Saccharolobus sp.]